MSSSPPLAHRLNTEHVMPTEEKTEHEYHASAWGEYREMTRDEYLAHLANQADQPDDNDNGDPKLAWDKLMLLLTERTRRALEDDRPRDEWGFLLPVETAADPPTVGAGTTAAEPLVQYVTLDQMAASVGRSKRTLEKHLKRKQNPLPDPDIDGGGGKANEWNWARVRPWLEAEYKRKLPTVLPAYRV